MAYTRIPSQHIIYSLVEEERGKDAGRMQTVFLRVIKCVMLLLEWCFQGCLLIFVGGENHDTLENI